MINPVYAVIGLWIVVMFITFLVTCVIAIVMNDKSEFIEVFSIALVIVVVILELFLCLTYVKFKINPENYGYTRIYQEATEVSE